MMTKGDFVAVLMVSLGFGGLMVFGGGRYGGDPPARYLFGLGSVANSLGFLVSLLVVAIGALRLREYIL